MLPEDVPWIINREKKGDARIQLHLKTLKSTKSMTL